MSTLTGTADPRVLDRNGREVCVGDEFRVAPSEPWLRAAEIRAVFTGDSRMGLVGHHPDGSRTFVTWADVCETRPAQPAGVTATSPATLFPVKWQVLTGTTVSPSTGEPHSFAEPRRPIPALVSLGAALLAPCFIEAVRAEWKREQPSGTVTWEAEARGGVLRSVCFSFAVGTFTWEEAVLTDWDKYQSYTIPRLWVAKVLEKFGVHLANLHAGRAPEDPTIAKRRAKREFVEQLNRRS